MFTLSDEDNTAQVSAHATDSPWIYDTGREGATMRLGCRRVVMARQGYQRGAMSLCACQCGAMSLQSCQCAVMSQPRRQCAAVSRSGCKCQECVCPPNEDQLKTHSNLCVENWYPVLLHLSVPLVDRSPLQEFLFLHCWSRGYRLLVPRLKSQPPASEARRAESVCVVGPVAIKDELSAAPATESELVTDSREFVINPGQTPELSIDTVLLRIPVSECRIRPDHLLTKLCWEDDEGRGMLCRDITGNPIYARRLYHRDAMDNLCVRVRPKFAGCKPGDAEVYVRFSVSRLAHGNNFAPVSRHTAEQVFRQVEARLGDLGIHADIMGAFLSRLDLNINLVFDQSVQQFLTVFDWVIGKNMKRARYATGIRYGTAEYSCVIYDKIEQMLQQHAAIVPGYRNVQRIELQAKRQRQVFKFYEVKTVGALLNSYQELPAKFSQIVTKKLFYLTPEDFVMPQRYNKGANDLVASEITKTLGRYHKNGKATSFQALDVLQKYQQGGVGGGIAGVTELLKSGGLDSGLSDDNIRNFKDRLQKAAMYQAVQQNPTLIEKYFLMRGLILRTTTLEDKPVAEARRRPVAETVGLQSSTDEVIAATEITVDSTDSRSRKIDQVHSTQHKPGCSYFSPLQDPVLLQDTNPTNAIDEFIVMQAFGPWRDPTYAQLYDRGVLGLPYPLPRTYLEAAPDYVGSVLTAPRPSVTFDLPPDSFDETYITWPGAMDCGWPGFIYPAAYSSTVTTLCLYPDCNMPALASKPTWIPMLHYE